MSLNILRRHSLRQYYGHGQASAWTNCIQQAGLFSFGSSKTEKRKQFTERLLLGYVYKYVHTSYNFKMWYVVSEI